MQLKTVIVVPWRSDNGGRRDELWAFTKSWIERHHNYEIICSDGDEVGRFNRGQAINVAAAQTDWDVLIVHDADTIADPELLREAVATAASTQQVIMPYETYIYLDKYSSDKLIANNGSTFTFLAPWRRDPDCCGRDDHDYTHTVLWHHHSGVQVFPRRSFERAGGFIEFSGWGYEDSVMADVLRVFDRGISWLRGSAVHLWHEHAFDPQVSPSNIAYWQQLHQLRSPNQMRLFLQRKGHHIP